MWAQICLMRSLSAFPMVINFDTRSSPLVIVPVLSVHRMSARARDSIACISWTRAPFIARRPTPMMKETEVRRTRPSGIIPIMPETVRTMALL